MAQLFLARVEVGVGEAGCTPASHSLISDYVPREQRASAMAVFSLGIPVGSLIVGLPGIVLGLISLWSLPEPRRMAVNAMAPASSPSLRESSVTCSVAPERGYVERRVCRSSGRWRGNSMVADRHQFSDILRRRSHF
ncbi:MULTISPECIES: MFS transporter [unclassified Sphingobium]|uniref:MFS transporter n=1 Tax=unclassified Sphingobium TaxID=2611147 RepID=UPI001F010414|nr:MULTISPECIES: MFS transporter [Sphingomonadaceae]